MSNRNFESTCSLPKEGFGLILGSGQKSGHPQEVYAWKQRNSGQRQNFGTQEICGKSSGLYNPAFSQPKTKKLTLESRPVELRSKLAQMLRLTRLQQWDVGCLFLSRLPLLEQSYQLRSASSSPCSGEAMCKLEKLKRHINLLHLFENLASGVEWVGGKSTDGYTGFRLDS